MKKNARAELLDHMSASPKVINSPEPLTEKSFWVVMKAHTWDSITTMHGISLMCSDEGPHRFIPVFNTREQAVAWAGSDEHVVKATTNFN